MEDESQKLILTEIAKAKTDSLKKKLLFVKRLTNERELVEKGYKKDLLELTYAYEEKYKSLYDQASKIIHGQAEADVSPADLEKYKVTKPQCNAEIGVPGFWAKAIINAKFFYTNDRDENILKHINDVYMEFKPDKVSFTVHYKFDTNPFFSNSEITKTFIYNETQELTKIESSKINWHSDEVNPTKILKKTQKKKKDKQKETTTQYEDVDSFFTVFRTDDLESPEAEADVSQEEEEADFIKEDLLPYALNYYLNIMPTEDDCGSCEDDEEDDDHHEHSHKKKGKGGKTEEAKEKCKNQ
jgi:hypothetical protein